MDAIHRSLIMRFPGRLVLEQVISPVATRLENGEGDAALARQRFLESWLHTKLGAHCHHTRPEDAQGNVLIAPLPGETRQLSVLTFALLASEAGRFINGQIIYVDGGIIANFGYVKGENDL